jgi:hypothetical protein
MYTSLGSASGIQDFTGANTSALTQTTNIRHNIILSSGWGIRGATLSYDFGWTTPVNIYNNTIVLKPTAPPYSAAWVTSQSSRNVKFYNNIYAGAADGSGYKAFHLNSAGPAIWDYNLYIGSGMNWALSNNSLLSAVLGAFTTQSTVAAAVAAAGGISGLDAHSIATNSPGFTGAGLLAQAYQLVSSSPARNSGRSDGTSGGAMCDMGAWGNGATQIGCSFAGGSSGSNTVIPMAPSLNVL